MRTLIFYSLILTFTLGFKKNSDSNNNRVASDIFPNKAGDYWIYRVDDTTYSFQNNISVAHYNLTVSVIDSVLLPDGIMANVWVYHYPNRTDTNYVYRKGDTILFAPDKTHSTETVREYILPISLHNTWKYSPLSVHEVAIDSMASINTGANQFENAFHIIGYPGRPDEIIRLDEWIADNVGVVKRYVDGSGTTNPYKYRTAWSLLNYHLE